MFEKLVAIEPVSLIPAAEPEGAGQHRNGAGKGQLVTKTTRYASPLGGILLAADDEGLIGAWFEGEKYFAEGLPADAAEGQSAILTETKHWLDVYFSGREPEHTPPLHPMGSAFRQEVWALLRSIPYGRTTTYGALAAQLAAAHGGKKMSAQAVGGAVGHNPISLLIPCHRVVGTGGSLTGYAGGIDKKLRLLELEQADTSRLFVPKKSRSF